MKQQGIIKRVFDTQTFGNNGFTKREFDIETIEQYPQVLRFELIQDKVDIIDPYAVGQTITVSINLRGREWTNPQGEIKVFNTLQVWRIEGEAISAEQHKQQSAPVTNSSFPEPLGDEDEDDLPY